MSIFTQSRLGTPDNQILFNDDDSSPYFRVKQRAPQGRNVRDLDLPLAFKSGISDWLTLLGKTAYIISGVMYPDDEQNADVGIRRLRKVASLDIEQDDPNSDIGYVPYVWGSGDDDDFDRQLNVKVLYVELVEDTRKGIVQNFRLVCKVKDPTIHGTTLRLANTAGSNPSLATGTAIHPFTYPIIYGASTFSVGSSITNGGDIDAYPESIVITGPALNPIITNVLTGEFIQTNVNLATITDVLRINYDKENIIAEVNGVSVLGSVTEASTFFMIRPGTNPITLSGTSLGSGASAQVSCYDAYPLS